MNIAIAGLGLIGGSFAKAIKQYTDHTVIGYDASGETLSLAKNCGAIDQIVESGFQNADLVLVGLYPEDTVSFLKAYRDSFQPGSMVIDLCGVKRFVLNRIRELFENTDITFIGGHPMAGREVSGFTNATPTLYQGASMILTPFDSTPKNKVEEASSFFRSIGFGRINITTEHDHDEMIAYTSQLAHIVSSAYARSPVALRHVGYSAGSFQDLTRVAKLNEHMWTELFLCNRDFLIEQIDVIIENMQQFQQAIANGDADTLRQILREGREIKEKLE